MRVKFPPQSHSYYFKGHYRRLPIQVQPWIIFLSSSGSSGAPRICIDLTGTHGEILEQKNNGKIARLIVPRAVFVAFIGRGQKEGRGRRSWISLRSTNTVVWSSSGSFKWKTGYAVDRDCKRHHIPRKLADFGLRRTRRYDLRVLYDLMELIIHRENQRSHYLPVLLDLSTPSSVTHKALEHRC